MSATVTKNVPDIGNGTCELCKSDCGLPHELMKRIAKCVFYYWREWAELEDIEQEVWAEYFGSRKRLDGLLASDAVEDVKLAEMVLFRAAQRYCEREQRSRLHVPQDYGYTYSKKTLRRLLPPVFGGDVAGEGSASFEASSGRSGGSATSGSDLDTMIIDVRIGLQKLCVEDRQTLFDVYGNGAHDAVTSHPEYAKAQRVLRKLQDALGGSE